MRLCQVRKRKLPLPASLAERHVQERTIEAECIRLLRGKKVPIKMVTKHMGISRSKAYRISQGRIGRPGRPRREGPEEARQAIVEKLDRLDGRISIRDLNKAHTDLSRRAIGDIKKAWTRKKKAEKRAKQKKLKWMLPGRVWALDGSKAKARIEAKTGRYLAMRDLATGYTLKVMAGRETKADVTRFLKELFAENGVPLVIKHDGGSAFKSKKVQGYLKEMGVATLLSHPYYPQYNGAVERGMQDIKGFAGAHANWRESPENWLQRDLDEAVDTMNTREVKWAGAWSTPQERFAARTPISALERALFQATNQSCQEKIAGSMRREAARSGNEIEEKALLTDAARLGTTRALEKGGYLVIEEGRLSQPDEVMTCVIISAG